MNYWKPAIYFVLFESFFWSYGTKFLETLYNIFIDGDRWFWFRGEYSGWVIFPDMIICLIFLIAAVWCFKMFIQSLVEALR